MDKILQSTKKKIAQAINIANHISFSFFETQKSSAKRFFAKQKLTASELQVIGSGALGIVLIIALTVTVSSLGTGEAADVAENAPVALLLDEAVPLAEAADDETFAEAAYAVVADGSDIVYLASKEDADAVLSGITDRYKTSGSEIVDIGFKEDVSVEARELEGPPLVFSIDDAVSYIITGTTEPRTYTIKGGDNLWDIAIANGISPYALQDMNPGLDPKRLSIGMEIYLYENHPFITVSFTEIVTKEERIAYNVAYEDDDSMYKGQTKVKSAGMYGSKEVVSRITKENGVVTASSVVSEAIVAEPVTQVTLKGTQAIPVYVGSSSGTLSSPVANINVCSSYGSRGGRRHNGVDLKNPTGTPIYASADGVVTFAAYSGTYGNIVKLSHGGGLETYYAHCDTMLVTVGETVSRGQQIATVGSTGNATTAHVHYEVRVNGTPKNPMDYIN
ncbi:MAG: peptidoglycan DD-metalloendopeptidase family protein [Clostridiales bacterium]|nr:peptidoglycan DD-metalloendopeptidase family protein [Clostridiales bacterium]